VQGSSSSCSWVPAFAGTTVGRFGRGKWIEPKEGDGEIVPIGVVPFDQLDLPAALPFLHPLLPHDGSFDVVIALDVHEPIDTVALGEPGKGSAAMLEDALVEIGRDSDVEGAVLSACEDVDMSAHRFACKDVWLVRVVDRGSCSWVPAFAGMTQ